MMTYIDRDIGSRKIDRDTSFLALVVSPVNGRLSLSGIISATLPRAVVDAIAPILRSTEALVVIGGTTKSSRQSGHVVLALGL